VRLAEGTPCASERVVEAGRMPFVSVIVPTYNDTDRLDSCLRELAAQSYPCGLFEVIVVDNGSAPGIVRRPGWASNVRLLHEPLVGSYAARNAGLRVARGEIIGFTDSDCLPARDWIATAAARMSHDRSVAFVGGRIDVSVPEQPTVVALYDRLFAFPQRQYVERDHFAATANVFVRRSVIEDIGDFNAALQSGGDAEWGRRVHVAGYGQQYDDALVVRHPARTSVRSLRLKAIRVASGLYAQTVAGRLHWIQLVSVLARTSVPSVSELFRIMTERSIPRPCDRVRVAAVAIYLRYVFCSALASFVLHLRRLDQRYTG
jgi:glycosyltransferase involved in cell wall biosynthesis